MSGMEKRKARILVVDDDKIALRNLQHVLKREGYQVVATQSGSKALSYLSEQHFDVVLTDLRIPKVDGLSILEHVKRLYPDTEVIVITAYATVDSAVRAMKGGACCYIAKPYKIDELRRVVAEAVEKRRFVEGNEELKGRLRELQDTKIIAEDPVMKKVVDVARQVAQSNCSVLITGESGTGKELVANLIHESSPRARGPMVAVNCGVFSEELLANELFGHERGAFTGADSQKIGLIESANGGTMFLDEITEIPPSMQVKLLRVLQEREIMRIGSTKPVKVDVRFLFATNRDIEVMVKEGEFRQDLYFRINVVNINLPPLSERKRDIPLLVHFFMEKYSIASGKNVTRISDEAMNMLAHYDYPGNVRELENMIERAIVLARGDTIEVEHLPDLEVVTFRPKKGRWPTLEEQEKNYIQWVLEKTGWNKTKAAEVLGIDRVSLWRKIKKYALET